jgi:hypothetical protein
LNVIGISAPWIASDATSAHVNVVSLREGPYARVANASPPRRAVERRGARGPGRAGRRPAAESDVPSALSRAVVPVLRLAGEAGGEPWVSDRRGKGTESGLEIALL